MIAVDDPAHVGAYVNICPYCGLGFPTREDLNAHIKECPARPLLAKIPLKPILVVAGIGVTASLVTAIKRR